MRMPIREHVIIEVEAAEGSRVLKVNDFFRGCEEIGVEEGRFYGFFSEGETMAA